MFYTSRGVSTSGEGEGAYGYIQFLNIRFKCTHNFSILIMLDMLYINKLIELLK